MLSRDLFYEQSIDFLDQIFGELEALGVTFPKHWHVDHLCYRVATKNDYVSLKKLFFDFADLLIESPVNGRNISTFRLRAPVLHKNFIIAEVELPEPKPGSHYENGFEHIEIVCDVPLDELPSLYPQLNWKADRTQKIYNDEIKLQLNAGAIKFHNQSLAAVVTLEKNRRVYEALMESKILEDLKRFNPLVVGTFPIGLDVSSSDIDIVLSHTNLQEVEEAFLKYYSYLPQFKMNTSCIMDRSTVTAHFLFKDVPIGLFAQRDSSFRQNGYRHFLIEERLLKIGGERFRNELLELRNQGLKTEPAFARVLGLKGDDPFQALLELYTLSDVELSQRLG